MQQTNAETSIQQAQGTVGTTIQLPAALWVRLKNEATEKRTTLRAVMIERLERGGGQGRKAK